MKNMTYIHCFIAGIFVASVLSGALLLSSVLAVLLIISWGNIILPLLFAVMIDLTFAKHTELYNAFGFMYSLGTLLLIVIFMSLRKSLNLQIYDKK